MAIDLAHFRFILESGAKGTALSAGYPDLLVRWEDIPGHEQMTPKPRANTEDLQKLHGWKWPIYDTAEIFEWMGLKLDVIDYKKIHGCERVVDLNSAAHDFSGNAEALGLGEYDLVIDPGTIEHCFNIAQAAFNLAGAVKLGGHIAQAVPMSMFNHGYYNLNPKWFIDFYGQNGFEIKRLAIRSHDGLFEPLANDVRYKAVPEESVLICLAQRKEIKPFVFPIDGKP